MTGSYIEFRTEPGWDHVELVIRACNSRRHPDTHRIDLVTAEGLLEELGTAIAIASDPVTAKNEEQAAALTDHLIGS